MHVQFFGFPILIIVVYLQATIKLSYIVRGWASDLTEKLLSIDKIQEWRYDPIISSVTTNIRDLVIPRYW